MGHTRKSLVLTVIAELAAICSAQGQPVAFVADAGARACLAQSRSVIPQSRSRHVDPNNSGMPNANSELLPTASSRRPAFLPAGREPALSAPRATATGSRTGISRGSAIVAYVVTLELLLAVMAAIACWLVLGLAGIILKLQERPVPLAVPAKTPSREALIPAQNLLTSVHPT